MKNLALCLLALTLAAAPPLALHAVAAGAASIFTPSDFQYRRVIQLSEDSPRHAKPCHDWCIFEAEAPPPNLTTMRLLAASGWEWDGNAVAPRETLTLPR